MGLLGLKRLMSMQRQEQERLRGHIQAPPNGSVVSSRAKRKRSSCQQDSSQGYKRMSYSGPDLPEDIWCHVLSLLPMRDDARVACVSQVFLRSWSCHPNLHFNTETLGLHKMASQNDGASADLNVIVDHIMEKHSTHMKTFKLAFYDRVVDACRLNSWLRTVATLRVEELCVSLPSNHYKKYPYNFPCSILADVYGNSMIQKLFVGFCAFRPVSGLANLTTLDLCTVHITGGELGSLVSNSSALERLTLQNCNEITYLKIPALLQRLSYLMMLDCRNLQMVECKAPNLSIFHYTGAQIQLSFGDAVHVKNMSMHCFVQPNTVYNARATLPSIVPNVETLNIYSISEEVNTPFFPSKFHHLKYLGVGDGPCSPAYDYLSLVSFLDACPVLETFELTVSPPRRIHNSDFEYSSHLRKMEEYHHDHIKNVKITGFYSAKSMVELACHIIENATSLECVSLDIFKDEYIDRHVQNAGTWIPTCRLHMINEARMALLVIKRYIAGKVPSTVKFKTYCGKIEIPLVLDPSKQCLQ